MSVGAITAGEAFVSVTCDNSGLVAGLQEASATIQTTARKVAAAEDALTVNVGIEGVDWLEKSLRRVESATKKIADEVRESSASATLFAAGFFSGLKSLVASTTKALGEFGLAFAKMELRTGVSATTDKSSCRFSVPARTDSKRCAKKAGARRFEL